MFLRSHMAFGNTTCRLVVTVIVVVTLVRISYASPSSRLGADFRAITIARALSFARADMNQLCASCEIQRDSNGRYWLQLQPRAGKPVQRDAISHAIGA